MTLALDRCMLDLLLRLQNRDWKVFFRFSNSHLSDKLPVSPECLPKISLMLPPWQLRAPSSIPICLWVTHYKPQVNLWQRLLSIRAGNGTFHPWIDLWRIRDLLESTNVSILPRRENENSNHSNTNIITLDPYSSVSYILRTLLPEFRDFTSLKVFLKKVLYLIFLPACNAEPLI